MPNKAMIAAEQKGRDAFLNGIPRDQCPYMDHRTMRGSVTFSRMFRRHWFHGWDEEAQKASASAQDTGE